MATDDYKTKWEQFLQEAVREAVKEQVQEYLGVSDDEMEDAEKFLAIPYTPPEPEQPLLSVAVLRTARAQLLGDSYNGRWGDFSYSDYAFLYDVGISLDKEDGGLL